MNFSLITSRDVYPVLTNGGIKIGNDIIEMGVPLKTDWQPQWGIPLDTDKTDMPSEIFVTFQALTKSCFHFSCDLQPLHATIKKLTDTNSSMTSITLAVSPYGHVCLWISIPEKAILLKSAMCAPLREDKIDKDWQFKAYMLAYINKGWESNITDSKISNLLQNFTKYTKQYLYKYHILRKGNDINSEDSEIQYNLSDCLTDASFDKLKDNALFNYHKAAVPEKIAICLSDRNKEYRIYLWTNTELMVEFFEKFYGAHPETKADFIIGIDTEKREYKLALFRQGLKAPMAIPEEAYQLIVFKNKFEDFRSENYDRPAGAWIW